MKKLHLGCGQRYLEGYINIDFPLSEHSVQIASIADEHHDISQLNYASNSINEVRLHHVFEHFERPIACALVSSWNSWLIEGGILHIEVPDFERTAKAALSIFKNKHKKKVAIRHLFGSHEASWAVHAEGYTEWMLEDILNCFGFTKIQVLKHEWRGTYNLEIIAEKTQGMYKEESIENAKQYLKGFLIDESEQVMLDIWLEMFKIQTQRTWAT